MPYVVQLEHGCWIADWDGDPGRTLRIENASRFDTISDATKALMEARKFRPFSFAIIVDPNDEPCDECGGLGYVEKVGVSAVDVRCSPCPDCHKATEPEPPAIKVGQRSMEEIQNEDRRKMAAEALSLLWDAMELSGSDAGIKLPGSENRAKYRQAYLHIGKMLLGDDCPEKEVLT